MIRAYGLAAALICYARDAAAHPAAQVRVVRCDCEKVHLAAGITATSECSCGRNLWPQMWRADQRKVEERDA